MKRNLYYIIASFTLLFTACTTTDFDSVNTDINATTEVNNLHMLNATLRPVFAYTVEYSGIVALIHHHSDGLGAQYLHFEPKLWINVYLANTNLNTVLNATKDKDDVNSKKERAMALIIKSFAFQRLTDTFGDAPYSEAGEVSGEYNLFPKYDSQESIYEGIINDLGEAIDLIGDMDDVNLGTADRIYGGDLQKWKKFANTLRLRLALRLRFVDSNKANELAQKAFAGDLIENSDESCSFKNKDDEKAYYYGKHSNMGSYRTTVEKHFVDYLLATNDLRLPVFARPAQTGPDAGNYVGRPGGYNGSRGDTDFSDVGSITYAKLLPTQCLMYSEVCLLKAEAYLYGIGVAADEALANEWYKKGIEASLKFWMLPDPGKGDVVYYDENDISTFVGAANLSGDKENKFKQIAMQKWLALVGNDTEAFAEMRRTGYPVIEDRVSGNDVILGLTNGVWPRRIPYPSSEDTYNHDQYMKAFDSTNRNSMISRVWWDTNPSTIN